tara:strand:- start:204 stop:494 length:291 start_codon:yes stop_codon:yes gene_type:complete
MSDLKIDIDEILDEKHLYLGTIVNISIFISHLIDMLNADDREIINAKALDLALKNNLLTNLQQAGLDIDIKVYTALEKVYKEKKENWEHIKKFMKT